MILAPQMVSQADKDGDQKLSKEEFTALAGAWFDKMDSDAAGKLAQEKFVEKFSEVLPPPQGFGGRGGGQRGGQNSADAPNRPRAEGVPPPARTAPGGPGRAGGRGFGPGGFGPGAFVAPGLFTAADADKDGSLSRTEFQGAFEKWFGEWDADKGGLLAEEKIRDGLNAVLPRPNAGGPGGPGFRGRGETRQPPQAGPRLSPADVKPVPKSPLYDAWTFRTFFLEFENSDWERELSDFYHTDVEVPAKLTVDGRTYPEIGVHFRGSTSYMAVGEGQKRSLNLSIDFRHADQQLGGYTTVNLLNSHSDPTFLRIALYNHIAREFIPAPQVNYVRVVINGESWGVYVNAQQFNKEFMKSSFGSAKGARWKMPGNPRGTGRFNYLGEDVAEYKRVYDIKSKDDPKAWADLITLCRTLDRTPPEKLEDALNPLLDLDGILKFLALDNALINSDGYWVRTGDYNICQDPNGRFHIIPNDANETFAPPNGPGFGGGDGPRVDGVKLDPLAGMDDPEKPLLHKLLAAPSLRARYLGYVRAIADQWLDWDKLGPLAARYQTVIADDVKSDARKLYPSDAFAKGVTEDIEEPGFRGPRRLISLKNFADQRRAYLLSYPESKTADSP
jgi:hypothetical protein